MGDCRVGSEEGKGSWNLVGVMMLGTVGASLSAALGPEAGAESDTDLVRAVEKPGWAASAAKRIGLSVIVIM